ncbi:hypothetical protein HNY73_018896 [Argiope bruennichi]|uniref:Uncharacterized protein n=1 Tax=Argiope bruennichi TaxID=94029 RepID=A0A8T0EFI8_ARGBR|nr:hypothetical protein HNY73_018896 [Argiope bruennichi]
MGVSGGTGQALRSEGKVNARAKGIGPVRGGSASGGSRYTKAFGEKGQRQAERDGSSESKTLTRMTCVARTKMERGEAGVNHGKATRKDANKKRGSVAGLRGKDNGDQGHNISNEEAQCKMRSETAAGMGEGGVKQKG